ncbi:MAG: hypothetical protein JWP89_2715 [Schlesneria sp.]|nr:hypothetical protein [Schlesneria sp.]
MNQQSPISEAMKLLFKRADQLREQRVARALGRPVAVSPIVAPESEPTPAQCCSNCGKRKPLNKNRRCAGCAKVTADRIGATARATRETRLARLAAWEPPPCCTRCSGPGPLSKRLKLCQECFHRHNEQQQRKHRVYRLVSTPKDHRMELVYDEEILKGRCPTCGTGIDPDLPACARHMTIVLLKKMRSNAVEV